MGHVRTDRRYLAVISVAVILAGAVMIQAPHGLIGAPLAQEQDDDDGGDPDGAAQEYTAGIYDGICDGLGADPAFPLTNVVPHGERDAGVYTSETAVAIPLTELLAEPRTIAILATGGDLAATRACADVSGQAVDGKLIAPLRAPNDDDLVGVAVLEESEGATETVVELYLVLSDDAVAVDDADDDAGDDDNADDNADGDGGV